MNQYQEILSQLKKRQFKPVYLLFGEEAYFIDQITDYIAKHALSEAEKGFNQTVFYGRDADPQAVIETAKRFPMMAEKQVVIIKEAQDFKKIESLESYMAQPIESTILVLAYKYKKPDGRKKVFKNAKKNGVYFESKPIYENQLVGWISDYITQHKRTISPKAQILIAEHVGTNLSLATNEMDKLFISIPAGGTIDDAAVNDVIGINKDYNVFELQRALGNKDFTKSMKIAKYLAAHQKENPFVVISGILGKYFTNLMLLYFKPTTSKQEAARLIGVNEYFVSEYFTAKKNYPAPTIAKIIETIRAYDLKSKGINSGSTPPGDLLIELISKILRF